MAIAFTSLTHGETTVAASIATASISPAANNLILITIVNKTNAGTPNAPTVTGNSLTWVQVNTTVFDTSGSQERVTVLRALGSAPTTGAATIDFAAQTNQDIMWIVDQASGVKLGGTNGSAAVVQSAVNGSGSASSITATLSAFSSVNNGVYAGFGQGGGGVTITNGAGYTSLFKGTAASSNAAIASEWRADNNTTPSFSVSVSSEVGIVGIEVAAYAGAGNNLIQSSGTASLAVGSTSVSWGGATTNANLVVVGVALTNAAVLGTVSSITDVQGNTYLKAITGTISTISDVLNTELWYAANIIGGAGSVNVFHTIDACAVYIREYSGYNTIDVTSSASGSSTAPNSGTSSATGVANELVVVATGDDKGATQTWTAAGTFADMVGTATTITGISMEDVIVAATGAQTGTLTLGSSANWSSLLATFKNVSTATSAPGFRGLLGVGQ